MRFVSPSPRQEKIHKSILRITIHLQIFNEHSENISNTNKFNKTNISIIVHLLDRYVTPQTLHVESVFDTQTTLMCVVIFNLYHFFKLFSVSMSMYQCK